MKTISLLVTLFIAQSLSAHVSDTITLALTGDIMMGTTYPTVKLPPEDGKLLFQHVTPILSKADIAAGNLEGTLCDGGTSTKRLSKVSYAFRTPVSYAPLLSIAGYDFLSMANNHVNDFGDEGISSSMSALDANGIKYAGIKGRCNWSIIEKDGRRYGYCAFSHNKKTCDHRDKEFVRSILTTLRDSSDFVIVSFHGGAEGATHSRLPYGTETYCGENRGSLRELAHMCIDEGADVVYGHGPHVVRAIEVYKNKFIAYSLGNFCTPYGMNLKGVNGYAPVVTVRTLADGTFIDGQIHSFIQQRGQGPLPDTSNLVSREIKRLTELDMPNSTIDISDSGTITRK